MDDNTITLKMTLTIDGRWSAQMSEEDLIEYLIAKLNNNLGFRGQVKKLRLVSPKAKNNG
jgi:hypothetical protein